VCEGKGFYCLYDVLYGQSPCRFNGIQYGLGMVSAIKLNENKLWNKHLKIT